MPVNVFIPARNEEEGIESTLDRLSVAGDTMQIHLIVNGSTDRTAEIARSFDFINVTELERGGKFLALQEGIRRIGDEAMNGFVILDADTTPIHAQAWAGAHQGRLTSMESGTYNGNVVYDTEAGITTGVLRNGVRILRTGLQRLGRDSHHIYGTNLAVKPTEYTRDLLLTAPNVWPHEDNMIIDMHELHAEAEHYVSMDPRMFVLTSARAMVPLMQRLRAGNEAALQQYRTRWAAIAPDGTVEYKKVKDAIMAGEFLDAAIAAGDYPELDTE